MSLTREAKHGWEIVRSSGEVRTADVLTWERQNSTYPTVAMDKHGTIYQFGRDGIGCAIGGEWQHTLRDAPPPKASGTFNVTIWQRGDGYTFATFEDCGPSPSESASEFKRIARLGPFPWTEGDGLEPSP